MNTKNTKWPLHLRALKYKRRFVYFQRNLGPRALPSTRSAEPERLWGVWAWFKVNGSQKTRGTMCILITPIDVAFKLIWNINELCARLQLVGFVKTALKLCSSWIATKLFVFVQCFAEDRTISLSREVFKFEVHGVNDLHLNRLRGWREVTCLSIWVSGCRSGRLETEWNCLNLLFTDIFL